MSAELKYLSVGMDDEGRAVIQTATPGGAVRSVPLTRSQVLHLLKHLASYLQAVER